MSGVLHILQYNRHYYAAGLLALFGLGALLSIDVLSNPARVIVTIVMGIVVFWSAGSLLASYYVYDYAGVTRWKWIPKALSRRPTRWLNIHAGLDESTETLMQMFPAATGMALDIYDPTVMTEASIANARRSRPAQSSHRTGRLDALPVSDRSCDTLFVLLTAHEIRQPRRRVELFKEAARVLSTQGQLLLAEHVRDWRNFLAFGPGFLHFLSRREWMRVARESGFIVDREGSVTPLVRWFLLRNQSRET